MAHFEWIGLKGLIDIVLFGLRSLKNDSSSKTVGAWKSLINLCFYNHRLACADGGCCLILFCQFFGWVKLNLWTLSKKGVVVGYICEIDLACNDL